MYFSIPMYKVYWEIKTQLLMLKQKYPYSLLDYFSLTITLAILQFQILIELQINKNKYIKKRWKQYRIKVILKISRFYICTYTVHIYLQIHFWLLVLAKSWNLRMFICKNAVHSFRNVPMIFNLTSNQIDLISVQLWGKYNIILYKRVDSK